MQATPDPDNDVEHYRELFEQMNRSDAQQQGSSKPTDQSSDSSTTNEDARLEAVGDAAWNATLLGWEPQGETKEEREKWAREKARQIRDYTILPDEYVRLRQEQSELVHDIHVQGYQGEAFARFLQMQAIAEVHNFQTSDPDFIAIVLHEMVPVLDEYHAKAVDQVIREVRAAHAYRPDAQFSFTFNRIQDDSGSRTFDFMHTMPNR